MDPEPMQLVANLAPAPSDVIWQNTYLSRKNRMIRAWSITLIIAFLTVFWSLLLIPLAGLLNLDSIGKVWPGLAKALEQHDISRTLIQTGLPTLLISLLNVAVPYIYYCKSPVDDSKTLTDSISGLSSLQGMISQGDVELSVISKNFFFTFFNLFIVFTIFGTASNAYGFFNRIGDSLKDTTSIAHVLATSLQGLAPFYINLIVLQGIGLFPFRLLEFGSVALYPVSLMGAKTPRGTTISLFSLPDTGLVTDMILQITRNWYNRQYSVTASTFLRRYLFSSSVSCIVFYPALGKFSYLV